MKRGISTDHLTPEQIHVCVGKGTEEPFTGEFLHNKEEGTYTCAVCEKPLFSSSTKYDSMSGWPSFYDVLKEGTVKLLPDNSLRMNRVEVICANCEAHLGHVFEDGPSDKTGKRYCINSLSLGFKNQNK